MPNPPPLNIPIPDPSDLTMRHFEKLQEDLRREFQTEIQAIMALIEERGKRTDYQITSGIADRNTMIQSLKELATAQNQASKEAVTKSEHGFAKEIDSIKDANNLDRNTFNTLINALSQRINGVETVDRAVKEARVDNHMTIGNIVGIVGGLIGVITFVISFAGHGLSPSNPTVGADTKRVDDLIATLQNRDRDTSARFDAMSARLNSLAIPLAPTSIPVHPFAAPQQ